MKVSIRPGFDSCAGAVEEDILFLWDIRWLECEWRVSPFYLVVVVILFLPALRVQSV